MGPVRTRAAKAFQRRSIESVQNGEPSKAGQRIKGALHYRFGCLQVHVQVDGDLKKHVKRVSMSAKGC